MRWSKPKEDTLLIFKNKRDDLHKMLQLQAKKFIYQLEMTEVPDEKGSHENWHYQGYMNLKKKQRPKALAKSLNHDFPGIELRPCSNAGKEALQKYCMKSDTRKDGPWSTDTKEVLQLQDIKVIKDTPYAYQKQILDTLSSTPDHRTINWVVDTAGNNGKSSFSKYIAVHDLGLSLTYGKTGDLLNLVFKLPKKRFYLFDLSRTKAKDVDKDDVYAALEGIKNGYFINTKYETGQWINDCPHVWVFANCAPNLDRMSQDRWKVWSLQTDHTLKAYVAPADVTE